MHPYVLNAFYNLKKYRSKLPKLIKKSKYEYFEERKQNTKTDTMKCDKRSYFQKPSDIKCVLNDHKIKITDRKLIAKEFNSYFKHVGKILAKK